MTTPLFKLLANSIRLGQPPEPVAAVRALVEVIAHQDAEMNELRQRISLLNSRLQFFEARLGRLETVSLQVGPPSSVAPHSPPAEGQSFAPPQQGYGGLAAPTFLPKAEPLPARVERPHSQRPPPFAELQNTDDPRDGEAGGTLVVLREDIDAVVRSVVENEAPFPLALPGNHSNAPDHLSATPFKPAASQPPPPMAQPTPAHGIALAPESHRTPAMAAAPSEGGHPPPGQRPGRAPAPRESYSDPYVAIEVDDTFSSTAEVAAARMPESETDDRSPKEAPAPRRESREPVGVPRRPVIVDENSFDEVLTSVHKRKP